MIGRPDAVLFDLDGTLADTGPDLAYALNRTLEHFGRPPLPYAAIRPVVSHGGIALTRLGFQMSPEEDGFEERRLFLLNVYAEHICRETRLFPGMADVLCALEQRSIVWGIVTNKPAWLTDPLIDAMGLTRRAACVVSGDTCSRRKPYPDPILHACRLIDCDASKSWYVGDAGRDMQAGRAAGCMTIGALYGYIHPEDPTQSWDSDVMIDDAFALLRLLDDDVKAG